LLQIATIENEVFNLMLNYGAKIGAAFVVGETTITINFLALLALFLIAKMIQNHQQQINQMHLET